MSKKFKILSKKHPIIPIIVAVAVVLIGLGSYWYISSSGAPSFKSITAAKGNVVQSVNESGQVLAENSASLSFEESGQIVSVPVNEGDSIRQGAVLAELDASSLNESLSQAQANVDAQEANLTSLQSGATQADIQVSQAAVTAAQQGLDNDYINVVNVVKQAYSETNNAVRNQLSPLFTTNGGSETSYPDLTFQISDQQVKETVTTERVQSALELNSWQMELQSVNSGSSTSTLDIALSRAISHLNVVQSFLIDMTTAVNDSQNLSSNTNAYQADVAAATNEVNTAVASVNGDVQSIASQKTAVQQQTAALNLKLSGATPEAIQAQQAVVEQAQAEEQNAEIAVQHATLIAPFSGTVTNLTAQIGQVVSPGAPVLSLTNNSGLKVVVYVSQTDVAKIQENDPANITLDAYGTEVVFPGTVTTVDNAPTETSGVPTYAVTLHFKNADSRIKSGMTAHASIVTAEHDNVLEVPSNLVINDNGSYFVLVKDGGGSKKQAVGVGVIGDAATEITSGLTEGEPVTNF